MKILYVVNHSGFFVSHRLSLALRARELGHEVAVVLPPGDSMDVLRASGVTWYPLPLNAGGFQPLHELETLRTLCRVFKEVQPAVVHNVAIKPVLYGTLAARLMGVPRVVNAVSGLGYLFTGNRPGAKLAGIAMYRLLLRHPQMRVILQNKEDFAFFQRNGLAPASTLRLIRGSGVDVQRFVPTAKPAGAASVVVQTSRLVGDKGVNEFAEAAKIVTQRYPEARFILVGGFYPGNPTALTEKDVRRLQEDGVVECVGHQNDVLPWLNKATIYCLASYREGLPKSLLEAAACGLPLVTTDTSGCKEVVTDDKNGLLVPVADGPALAEAIMKLIADPALMARLGRNARESAVSEFALGNILDQQIALYTD